MTDYIERDVEEEYFNPASSTVAINPTDDSHCKCHGGTIDPVVDKDEEALKEKWKWLAESWYTMTYKEKYNLFQSCYHYINLRDVPRDMFDEVLNKDIADFSYKTCREEQHVQYVPDYNGIPTFLVEFNAIDYSTIPDSYATLKNDIKNWSNKYIWGYVLNY